MSGCGTQNYFTFSTNQPFSHTIRYNPPDAYIHFKCTYPIARHLAQRLYQSKEYKPEYYTVFEAQVLRVSQLSKIPGIWTKNIRLADLVEDFRELQAVEILRDNAQGAAGMWTHGTSSITCVVTDISHSNAAGRECKGAIRALIPLLQGDANQVIKLSVIEEVIPKSNGRAWRTIREKVEHNKIASLEELDEKTRALAMFIRVNS